MKKILISAVLFLMVQPNYKACADYYPDGDYFNLFTQSIIKDKSYLPFLLSYSNRFYDHEHFEMPDENIEAWQKFFNNTLNYQETKNLVYKISMNDLNAYKKGTTNNSILKKLGAFSNHQEAIDYLIEAKYLEPFMSINYVEDGNSFYYRENENTKNATQLDYDKTATALVSLYNATKNREIKLRYAYQLVRLNHYTRNYPAAIEAFSKYVEPLKLKSAPYFWAVDQMAGAQRGLNQGTEANWNFFKVFMNSKSRRESAFVSMKLSDSASFKNIMDMAQTNEEKNMAYFLLGYEDFNNPLPTMEKMFAIDPSSEILKVMAARSINELERSYLPVYFSSDKDNNTTNSVSAKSQSANTNTEIKEVSFWDKVVLFFKNIFGGTTEKTSKEKSVDLSDKELLNNPNRIPLFTNNTGLWGEEKDDNNYVSDFEKFVEKTKTKSDDEFWQIADAYLKFLKMNYEESNEILSEIKTTNPEYKEQIDKMKMLNDIVAQPKITADFENEIMKKYADVFVENKKKDSLSSEGDYYSNPSTSEFLKDILANRYFLQGEDGKSFLMNNRLSDLQNNPDSDLVKSIEEFYRKPNKTEFEKQVISKNMDHVGDVDAYFNLIYGDRAMRLADFKKAQTYYKNALNFSGLPNDHYEYNETTGNYEKLPDDGQYYDGFKNISSLVFGYNIWESYGSKPDKSMKAEGLSNFSFIKEKMNKLELSEAIIQLQKIGEGKDQKASEANQLIGNLLYNTSVLGYFRELFVMDIDNSNGGKYHFWNTGNPPYQYYYKNFTYSTFIKPDNFDLALNYYNKALSKSNNKEQKARIVFQMASAEQGKYYQYEAKNQLNLDYADPKWSEKMDAHNLQIDNDKNTKFRTYFTLLKTQYRDTETSKNLQGSCSYYDYFLMR